SLTENDREIALLRGHGGPTIPRFSPGGQFLFVRHENTSQLELWRLSRESPVRMLEATNVLPPVAFGDRDQFVAYARMDEQILIHQLPSGQLKVQIHFPGLIQTLAIRPAGRPELAVASNDVVSFY